MGSTLVFLTFAAVIGTALVLYDDHCANRE
jgi:hypothetical protein